MTPDPVDQLSARLFESARSEAVPRGAEQHAIEMARREMVRETTLTERGSEREKWLAAAACVALAAAVAFLLRPKDTVLGISAEPSTVVHVRPEPRHVTSSTTSAVAPIEPSRSVTAPSVTVPASSLPSPSKPTPTTTGMTAAPAHSAPASLSEELSALKVASSALGAGDAKGALAALDRYDRVLKGQKLRAEATLLKIEALSRSGEPAAASALAQRFVDQNPGSPLVDRARSFVVQ